MAIDEPDSNAYLLSLKFQPESLEGVRQYNHLRTVAGDDLK